MLTDLCVSFPVFCIIVYSSAGNSPRPDRLWGSSSLLSNVC